MALTFLKQTFTRYVIREKVAQAHQSPFAQGIHDGGTLENKSKYQAFGLQFVDQFWRRNHVICIGFVPSQENTSEAVSELFNRTVRDRTLQTFSSIVASVIQDRAAKAVASELDLESEVCGMHDGDKLGRSAVGNLVRSKNHHKVNPFNEGEQLMALAHKIGTHFSYSDRFDNLRKIGQAIQIPVADVCIQLDLNTTRIASQHGLLESLIRNNHALTIYQLKNPTYFSLSPQIWTEFAEFEAVLDVTRLTTTLCQAEQYYCGAYGALIKELTMKSLRAENWMSSISYKSQIPQFCLESVKLVWSSH